QKLVTAKGKRSVHAQQFALERESDDVRLEVALQWTEATEEVIRSYANGIPTPSGGTHDLGFKQALGKAIRAYMAAKQINPKGVTLAAEDIREGVYGIVSAFVPEPQFQGQTKDRLNNPEVSSIVESTVRVELEQWLLNNASAADA